MCDHRAGTWIVIPAYNEATRIRATLEGVKAYQPDIVVVDDGSTDATADEALTYPVYVLRHPTNCGQGAALQTGIDFALSRGASIIITFDADGQHLAEDVERLVEPLQSGAAQVTLGSRFLGKTIGISFWRKLVLRLAVVFTRVFSQIDVTDTHNGLRGFLRCAAAQIRIRHNGMAHASEILDQVRHLGLSYQEVPVTVCYTTEVSEKGQSSWNAVRIVGQLLLRRMIQ